MLGRALALWGLTATLAACETGAVGVDACRQIELARCQGTDACEFGVELAACERFARDNCLHGLPGEQPGDAILSTCTDAIEAAIGCAERSGADTKASACDDDELSGAGGANVCALVMEPERLDQCSFLGRDSDESEDRGSSESDGGDDAATAGEALDASVESPDTGLNARDGSSFAGDANQ